MKCYGRNADTHCCYVNNVVCKFLEENSEPGFRWSCQLRRENGSWQAAIDDPRYMQGDDSPGKLFAQFPYKNCKNFQCRECGLLERGEITQEHFLSVKEL